MAFSLETYRAIPKPVITVCPTELEALDADYPVFKYFNHNIRLPYGITAEAIFNSMCSFLDDLVLDNTFRVRHGLSRLELFLTSSGFSTVVSEEIKNKLPIYCPTLVANGYANGRPDILIKSMYEDDSTMDGTEGLEHKATNDKPITCKSHHPYAGWLMCTKFKANKYADNRKANYVPLKFRYAQVSIAKVETTDWKINEEKGKASKTAQLGISGKIKLARNILFDNRTTRQKIAGKTSLIEWEKELELQITAFSN